MDKKNYYLELLYTKVQELKKVLEEIESSNFNLEYKKYLISGYIITLDSILEIGIGDLHSSNIDELTSLIYYTRQKAVHYGYFNGLHNIEDTANKIIELTSKNYEKEQKYYKNLFNANISKPCNNIVIKNSSKISEDPFFYKFINEDNTKVLCVPVNRIFKLTEKNKNKIESYIIDTTNPLWLRTAENNSLNEHKELYGEEIKDFFKKNFTVTSVDFNEHNKTIKNIIGSFLSDPLNSTQITEYKSNDQFCKNTIEIIKDFLQENTMYSGYIKNYNLLKNRYSLAKMETTDFSRLKATLQKTINQSATEKDVFFIKTLIKRASHYCDILSSANESKDFKVEILSPILIQLFEIGPKHFSQDLINSNNELKKCYANLMKYRQIFSHYILLENEYKKAILEFNSEFINLINILNNLNLTTIKNFLDDPKSETFCLIERDKSDFFNYKHEQFLKISDDTYIGKKIRYSSHNPNSKSLIAIVSGGSNAANTLYYKKDWNGYLIPEFTIDKKTKKKTYVTMHHKPLIGAKETKIDFELTNLFRAYFKLNCLKENSNIIIIFSPCKENGDITHYDDLDTLILRFFNQGYLPVELLQKNKLDLDLLSKGIISLLDCKGTVIATIINKQKAAIDLSCEKDKKTFFSRIDAIKHDFSKRRHS